MQPHDPCPVPEARKARRESRIPMGWDCLGAAYKCRVAPGAPGTTICPRTGVGEDAGRKCLPPEHPAAGGRWAGGSDAMFPAVAAGGMAEGDQRLPGDVCAFDSGNVRATVSRLHVQGAPTSPLCRAAVHCTGDLEAVNVNPSVSELFTESACSFQGHLANVMLSVSWVRFCLCMLNLFIIAGSLPRSSSVPWAEKRPPAPRGDGELGLPSSRTRGKFAS